MVAATNRPNDIEPALRRPGRLDREIQFVPPGIEVYWLTSLLAQPVNVSNAGSWPQFQVGPFN